MSAISPLVYIHGCGSASALGLTNDDIHSRLLDGKSPDMQLVSGWLNNGRETVAGKVTGELPSIPDSFHRYDSANNRLALSVLVQISEQVHHLIEKYGKERVAVIIGTSVSGMANGEEAMATRFESGRFPGRYHYAVQEPNSIASFVADYYGIEGPAYTVSTACSSSGRVFLSARRLLKAGIADAVIVGGADSLCRLTLNGFNGLEAISTSLCNPFSANRNGINIGEAAAFMLLSLSPDDSVTPPGLPPIALLGAGDSSDAYHISAPHPEGKGAEQAMRKALDDAGLAPGQIGYINAHGTATLLNDEMEANAIYRVFGSQTPVSSTKPLTGHTLGAAGAVEAAICWHILRYQIDLPQQANDGQIAESLPPLKLVEPGTRLQQPAILSNSFAFGGNNVSLVFGYADD